MRPFKPGIKLIGFILMLSLSFAATAQQEMKLGAYYFDGWTGKTYHLTDKLKNSFPEREPVWGWLTSTPEIMEKQIDVAKASGIDFFDFCWYYNPLSGGTDVANDPKNNALNLYRQASNKNKLGFTIMVANHEGYAIKAEEWNALCTYWISLFKDASYVKVNDKPLITFYDMMSLIRTFGTSGKVKEAFETFKSMAVKEGLQGVSIAAIVNETVSLEWANKSGYDIITGYNYHTYGYQYTSDEVIPIDSMRVNEERIWNALSRASDKPFIPAITVNWDKRPWEASNVRSPRFSGFSNQSVNRAVSACREWMARNRSEIAPGNVAILYAWNEYGEGAYLTPCKTGDDMVQGVKKAMLFQIPATTGP